MTKLSEKQIIQIFQKKFGNKKSLSEDVESIKLGRLNIIAKVDTLVQSTDIPPQMTLKHAARKSIVACISDFAAKGVKPEYAIVSINIPNRLSKAKIQEVADGLKSAGKEFSIKILGGDTNEGREVVIHVCVFGIAETISKRKGANNDDLIFVTGPFGLPASGLHILLNKKKGTRKFMTNAINSVLKPKPKINFCLKSRKLFTSSMDSSDGLSTTLNEMANQSKKKFIINNMPVEKGIEKFANINGINYTKLVFDGGEEYEVIFTTKKKNRSKIIRDAIQTKTPIIEIGYVTSGRGVYLKKNHSLSKIKDSGWKHFSR